MKSGSMYILGFRCVWDDLLGHEIFISDSRRDGQRSFIGYEVNNYLLQHYYIPEFSEAELMGQPSMVRLTGHIVMFILTNQNSIMISK